MNPRKHKLWLCLPSSIALVADAALTLIGQPEQYWQGMRDAQSEGFPLFAWGLSISPWLFILMCALWLLAFAAVIILAPDFVSEVLAVAMLSGHTWGMLTWLFYEFGVDFHLCILTFFITATIFVICHRKWRSLCAIRTAAPGKDA